MESNMKLSRAFESFRSPTGYIGVVSNTTRTEDGRVIVTDTEYVYIFETQDIDKSQKISTEEKTYKNNVLICHEGRNFIGYKYTVTYKLLESGMSTLELIRDDTEDYIKVRSDGFYEVTYDAPIIPMGVSGKLEREYPALYNIMIKHTKLELDVIYSDNIEKEMY